MKRGASEAPGNFLAWAKITDPETEHAVRSAGQPGLSHVLCKSTCDLLAAAS